MSKTKRDLMTQNLPRNTLSDLNDSFKASITSVGVTGQLQVR